MRNLLIICLLASLLISCSVEKRVCFKDSCIFAEVADTPAALRQGLMHRNSLPQNKGMLFVFKRPAQYGMWMKDTTIVLDILWLDRNKRIIQIQDNVQPCITSCPIYQSPATTMYVLEVNANFTKDHQIKIGDQVNFD